MPNPIQEPSDDELRELASSGALQRGGTVSGCDCQECVQERRTVWRQQAVLQTMSIPYGMDDVFDSFDTSVFTSAPPTAVALYACGHPMPEGNAGHQTRDGVICDTCNVGYVLCACCNQRVSEWLVAACHTVTNEQICDRCRRENYRTSNCMQRLLHRRNEEIVHAEDNSDYATLEYANDNWYYSESDDNWYTSEEASLGEVSDSSGLLGYSENVLRHCEYDKAAIKKGELVFGVELEMESRHSRNYPVPAIVEALGGAICERYILKEDGSLSSGVELVTIPMTLSQHRKDFNWEGVLKPIETMAHSGIGTSNCGIHIHINRRALSQLVIGKMLVFLNSDALDRYVELIAQRSSTGYANKVNKCLADGKRLSESRYERLNVQEATCEMRIFRGNLRPERILKNLEFAHALVNYCRVTSIKDIESWDNFAGWLQKKVKDYPMLCAFLYEKKCPGFTRKQFSIPRAVRKLAQQTELLGDM